MDYPICINCDHCCGDDEPICSSDASITPDLVRGGVYYKECFEMRNTQYLCGKKGVFFEEKE